MFGLNEEQRRAVEHRGGPLLILAGAGTGKTATLAHRLASLLGDGADPQRVCLLTFTRRAAGELVSRAGLIGERRVAGRVWGGTFHAVANRILRRHGRHLGLDPSFTILDQGDATDLFGLVRDEVGLGRGSRRAPKASTLAAIYSRVVGTGERLPVVLERFFPWCAAEVDGVAAAFTAYTERKRSAHLLDFDDLLVCWSALADVPGLMPGLFDHVLVDEYQDTSPVQADILAALRPGGVGLTVVGDDAQAIYGFRAATAENILGFPDRFPQTTVVRLERNYRSTMPILAVANAVMAEARPGRAFPKALWSKIPGATRPRLRTCSDETGEAEAICDSVLAHREQGVALSDQAVLFRAAHHPAFLELALARRNIPFVKYGGLRFLEAAHVKDLLGLLRILENPADELAWFRVLRLLEGIGPATARRVMTDLGVGTEGASALQRLLDAPPTVPPAARPEFDGLRLALADCMAELPPGAQVERLRRWLEPVLARCYDAAPARAADLEQLERVAAAAGSRSRFLADITLDPPTSTSDLAGAPTLDEDWLVLSTVHSAKGGEWTVVHLLHASDGMFPSDLATGDPDSLDQERRLFYVAVTRARRVLEINVPLRYHHDRPPGGDTHSFAQPSRFLSDAVRATMDSETQLSGLGQSHDRAAKDSAGGGQASGLAGIDRRLAGLWS